MTKLTQLLAAGGDWLVRCLKWIGFLAIYLVDTLLLSMATSQAHHPQVATRLIGVVLIYSAFLLAFLTWRYWQQIKKNNPRHIGKTRFTTKRSWQLAGLFILMLAIQMGWNLLISAHILPSPANQTELNAQILQLPFWNLSYAILLAPFVEEMIFRGIFLNYFFRQDSRVMNLLGVFMSGMIFGMMHVGSFTPTLFMYAALGWILGFTYLKFRDLRYNVTLHFLNNALSLLAYI
ncbi:CPBP family intramembrane glutamic endopeptidase [Levilactobacillus angrenensis]|uniref:CPBP family intramembrane glutamic endopeptidase n=1 Tax=Levilactobacillus angrenensis TaxID=2486020 RepID=A0ABW1UAN6_9LACO|nr:type II CAAX endopeptidase family protein [Levilactobacillus angrenensis]